MPKQKQHKGTKCTTKAPSRNTRMSKKTLDDFSSLGQYIKSGKNANKRIIIGTKAQPSKTPIKSTSVTLKIDGLTPEQLVHILNQNNKSDNKSNKETLKKTKHTPNLSPSKKSSSEMCKICYGENSMAEVLHVPCEKIISCRVCLEKTLKEANIPRCFHCNVPFSRMGNKHNLPDDTICVRYIWLVDGRQIK